jgi:hypothetical protein
MRLQEIREEALLMHLLKSFSIISFLRDKIP